VAFFKTEVNEAQPSLDNCVARHQITASVLGKNTRGGEAERCFGGSPCRDSAWDRYGIKIRWLWRKRVN
jgi:hypothetical protein